MTIQELCEKLRNKRTELGLNIEEVVEKTKLYPSVIRDIESGNLSNIASAYLKGYIRIYASFLKVDLEDALENINKASPLKAKPAQARQELSKEKKQEPKQEYKVEKEPLPPHIKKIIFYVILIIIILPFLVAFIRFVSKSISQAPKKPAVKLVKSAKPVAKIPVTQNISKEVTAALTAKKDCFVRVKVDGKVLFEGVLKKGASENWKGRKEIEFKISDGSNVYLEVNGKALPSLTSAHKPIKSLKITSSGVTVSK